MINSILLSAIGFVISYRQLFMWCSFSFPSEKIALKTWTQKMLAFVSIVVSVSWLKKRHLCPPFCIFAIITTLWCLRRLFRFEFYPVCSRFLRRPFPRLVGLINLFAPVIKTTLAAAIFSAAPKIVSVDYSFTRFVYMNCKIFFLSRSWSSAFSHEKLGPKWYRHSFLLSPMARLLFSITDILQADLVPAFCTSVSCWVPHPVH